MCKLHYCKVVGTTYIDSTEGQYKYIKYKQACLKKVSVRKVAITYRQGPLQLSILSFERKKSMFSHNIKPSPYVKVSKLEKQV